MADDDGDDEIYGFDGVCNYINKNFKTYVLA